MWIKFADGVKNVHDVDLGGDFGDWDSQMEGNWKGKITALR